MSPLNKRSTFWKLSSVLASLVLILGGVGAGAGDWSSSGGMELPYIPAYEFQYSCDVVISLQGSSDLRREKARASFEVSNSSFKPWQIRINTKDLNFGDTKVPTSGGLIYLSFKKGSSPDEDLVRLDARIEQEFEQLRVGGRGHSIEGREGLRISTEARVDVRSNRGEALRTLEIFVNCQKEK